MDQHQAAHGLKGLSLGDIDDIFTALCSLENYNFLNENFIKTVKEVCITDEMARLFMYYLINFLNSDAKLKYCIPKNLNDSIKGDLDSNNLLHILIRMESKAEKDSKFSQESWKRAFSITTLASLGISINTLNKDKMTPLSLACKLDGVVFGALVSYSNYISYKDELTSLENELKTTKRDIGTILLSFGKLLGVNDITSLSRNTSPVNDTNASHAPHRRASTVSESKKSK